MMIYILYFFLLVASVSVTESNQYPKTWDSHTPRVESCIVQYLNHHKNNVIEECEYVINGTELYIKNELGSCEDCTNGNKGKTINSADYIELSSFDYTIPRATIDPPKAENITISNTSATIDWIWKRTPNAEPPTFRIRLFSDQVFNVTMFPKSTSQSILVSTIFNKLNPASIYLTKMSVKDVDGASNVSLLAFITLQN